MKKRIFSLLLAVCMVLAAVPAVTAAPAEQHTVSVDSAQLKQAATAGVLAQDSAVLDSDLLNAAATVAPMAAEDFAVYGPNVLGMACKAGTTGILRAVAYVPTVVDQEWNVAIYAGTEPTEDDFVFGWYNTFDEGAGYYNLNVPIETAEWGMKPGTYTAIYFTSQGDYIIDGTVVATYFYVTESDVALERVYFADYTTSGYPQVNTLNLARGASLVTDYGVCVAPEKTTVDRTEKYVSNAASLQVSSFQGLLSVEAGEYGVFQVTGTVANQSAVLTVNVCTDAYGHDFQTVETKAPTCTEAGSRQTKCAKCGYVSATESVPALGHSWDEGKITVEETEDAWGEKLFTCTRCGVTKTESYHTCPGAGLSDMPKDDNWAHKGIDYCLEEGLMVGMENNRFYPFNSTTRGQVITVLWRMAGSPECKTKTPFTDLTQNFYQEAVAWGYENGIVKGVTETTFGPARPVTREQLAAFFYRYAENILKLDVSDRTSLEEFPDHGESFNYSKECLS